MYISHLYPLCVVDKRRKDDDSQNEEEDKQHELFGGRPESLDEDLEPRRVAGEFEQPQNPDD